MNSRVQNQEEENEKRLFYSLLQTFDFLSIASLVGDTLSIISQKQFTHWNAWKRKYPHWEGRQTDPPGTPNQLLGNNAELHYKSAICIKSQKNYILIKYNIVKIY